MPILTPGNVVFRNYNTPADVAGVAPTLDYRFALDRTEIDAVSLTDKLTFTRSATCAFTDAGGNLDVAGANVPRFNHNSSRQSLGLFMEGSATNFVPNSIGSNFISPKPPIFPSLNFGSFVMTSGTTSSTLWSHGSSYNQIWNVTFYLYNTSQNQVQRFVWEASTYFGSPSVTTTVDGITLTATTEGNTAASITNLGNNLYRLNATGRTNSIGQLPFVRLRALPPVGQTFVGGEVCLASHMQLESGTTPTSYIVTTGSSVTRTETATISLAGLPATRTLVEKPAGCASIADDTLTLNTGYTIERVMVFPVSLTAEQITAIRNVM
jgi:hypothetical protein